MGRAGRGVLALVRTTLSENVSCALNMASGLLATGLNALTEEGIQAPVRRRKRYTTIGVTLRSSNGR